MDSNACPDCGLTEGHDPDHACSSDMWNTIHLNDDQALVLIATNDHHADELRAAADLIPDRFKGRVLVVGEDLAASVLPRGRFELVRDTLRLRAEVQGIVRAGQLPEAETAILADLLAEFEASARNAESVQV